VIHFPILIFHLTFWYAPYNSCSVNLDISNIFWRFVDRASQYIWYHHTYRYDDTRCCIMQFWPPDDEHMCSKHVEAWNKLILKQTFCASSWLIAEINIKLCHNSSVHSFQSQFCDVTFTQPRFDASLPVPNTCLALCCSQPIFITVESHC